jgi:hypothetical protein
VIKKSILYLGKTFFSLLKVKFLTTLSEINNGLKNSIMCKNNSILYAVFVKKNDI